MMAQQAASTFSLRLHHGIWHVRLNGRFFGDYRSEQTARASIAEVQRNLTEPSKVVRE